LSFFDKHSFFPAQRWVGLGNYARIAGDAEFWDSLWKGVVYAAATTGLQLVLGVADRKSTRLNSSHVSISYAVFCLKKKKIVIPAFSSLSSISGAQPRSKNPGNHERTLSPCSGFKRLVENHVILVPCNI